MKRAREAEARAARMARDAESKMTEVTRLKNEVRLIFTPAIIIITTPVISFYSSRRILKPKSRNTPS